MIILVIMTISRNLYGIVYSIDEIVSLYIKNGFDVKIINYENEKIDLSKKELKGNILSTSTYFIKYDFRNTIDSSYFEKEKKNLKLGLNSNGIYIDANVEENDLPHKIINSRYISNEYKYHFSALNVGFSTSLKELFYSDESFKRKTGYLDLSIKRNNLSLKNIELIKEFIDEILVLKNSEAEVKNLNITLREENALLDILRNKYEENELSEEDFLLAKNTLNNTINKITEINEKINRLKRYLIVKTGLEISEHDLELENFIETELKRPCIPIEVTKNIEVYRKIQVENIKYKSLNALPNIDFNLNYEIISNNLSATISFSDKLFKNKLQRLYEIKELKKINLDLENNRIEDENKSAIIFEEYKNLLNDYLYKKDSYEIMCKKYEKAKRVFTRGELSVMDFIKISSEKTLSGINAESARNNLFAFSYKINKARGL